MLETRSVYSVDLEIRQDGERPVIAGRFPYGGLAIIGARRQERFLPGAFRPGLDVDNHEINFLLSHDMARPLASRNAGTLTLVDSPEALTFGGKVQAPTPGRRLKGSRNLAPELIAPCDVGECPRDYPVKAWNLRPARYHLIILKLQQIRKPGSLFNVHTV